jgi:hypothetical protein
MAEAARHLKIKKETLRNRVKVAKLNVHQVGALDVITKDALDTLEKMGDPRRGRPPTHGKQISTATKNF